MLTFTFISLCRSLPRAQTLFHKPFLPSLCRQEKAVRIVAVGVGEYQDFEGQLEEIGGENVYNVNNFDELPDLFEDILKETCSKYKGCSVQGVLVPWKRNSVHTEQFKNDKYIYAR